MLQLREQSGELHVLGAARLADSIGEFDALPSDERVARIRRAIGQGFSGRRCLIAMPRQDVHLQSVRLPSMPDADLKQAVAWEAAQRFDLERETMESDFMRTGAILQAQEGRDEVLIVAASHTSIMPRIECFLEAGLRPEGVEPGFSSSARFYSRRCRRDSDRNLVRVITEVGASGSSVMVLRGDQIAFVKSLGISGNDFDQAVMQSLQLDEAAARDIRATRIRSNHGDESETRASDRAVYEAVRPFLCELVKEIVLCLRYYSVTFRGHPPEQVILTGGDGLEPQLVSILGEACQLPVLLDDTSGTLARITPMVAERVSGDLGTAPSWAVAAGASMQGLTVPRSLEDDASERVRREAAA